MLSNCDYALVVRLMLVAQRRQIPKEVKEKEKERRQQRRQTTTLNNTQIVVYVAVRLVHWSMLTVSVYHCIALNPEQHNNKHLPKKQIYQRNRIIISLVRTERIRLPLRPHWTIWMDIYCVVHKFASQQMPWPFAMRLHLLGDFFLSFVRFLLAPHVCLLHVLCWLCSHVNNWFMRMKSVTTTGRYRFFWKWNYWIFFSAIIFPIQLDWTGSMLGASQRHKGRLSKWMAHSSYHMWCLRWAHFIGSSQTRGGWIQPNQHALVAR